MGMSYHVIYHNALITPERYPDLVGGDHDGKSPESLAELALEQVHLLLDDWCEPTQDEKGINLDGCGYTDSASYSYGITLQWLLGLCEPGAYTHEIDTEEASGDQWRNLVLPDRTIKEIWPEIVWPPME